MRLRGGSGPGNYFDSGGSKNEIRKFNIFKNFSFSQILLKLFSISGCLNNFFGKFDIF